MSKEKKSEFANLVTSTFNTFDGQDMGTLSQLYAEDVVFEDPVTSVKGLKKLAEYYAHAYKNVKSIRFDFKEFGGTAENFFATWVMTLEARGLNAGKPVKVRGVSHFKFNEDGKAQYHRDYLDLGEMVYENLPVQGLIIKGIKKLLG